MALEELGLDADRENMRTRDKLIGVYVGILAVILAICSMGGSNAEQNALQGNIAASNVWAFFQAKNARRQALRLHTEEFDALLKMSPSMPDDAKKLIEAKIADYNIQDKQLTSDPKSGEGLDELFTMLASVALISGGNMLLYLSFVLGGFGTVLTVGGFTLAFPLPAFMS